MEISVANRYARTFHWLVRKLVPHSAGEAEDVSVPSFSPRPRVRRAPPSMSGT
jgi:hypothetical protein